MLCPFCREKFSSLHVSRGSLLFVHTTTGDMSRGCSISVERFVGRTPRNVLPVAEIRDQGLTPTDLLALAIPSSREGRP